MSRALEQASGTALNARDIAYAYHGAGQVLEKVSAQIVPGSFLAILGVNGCGKSTLLSCLDDIIHPQRGTVTLAGKDIAAYTREERARQIALVAQHSHAHGVTVYDALLLGRKPYIKAAPTDEDFAIVDRVIDELGLGPLALRYLDEPTNNLDMANQIEVMELISEAAHEHDIACAAVLHDINLALRYCDRFLMLKDGLVRASGGREVMTKETIEEVYGVSIDLIAYEDSFLVVPKKGE